MAVYAIADLHLSDSMDKSMDIFGKHWENHADKIEAAWRKLISSHDTVLIPGDISWAMKLSEAQPDLDRIGRLPGEKYMIRGNHDYWWSSINKVRSVLAPGLHAIQNDSFLLADGTAICGTRGWIVPGAAAYEQDDEKIYLREVGRLKLSLDHARDRGAERIIAMTHYPPFNDRQEPNEFTRLFTQYGVEQVVYGHLHGVGGVSYRVKELDGVQYKLTSCDYLCFVPALIREE